MNYQSTRNSDLSLSSAEAIMQGLSRDGGLFVPVSIPQLTDDFLSTLTDLPYAERSAAVMKLFLSDFTDEELKTYTNAAYGNFDTESAAPLHRLDEKTSFMELWHGPTCAFKDIALQILPYLLTASMRKTDEPKKVCILVATSGDTGKAALEGFRDVPGTGILVFYPRDGVSDVQKLQMQSQMGNGACWGIFEKAWGCLRVAGCIIVGWVQWAHRSATVSYWLGENFTGRGLATESLKLVSQKLFSIGINRIELSAAENNPKSAAVARRAGFSEEGISRDFERINGIFRNHIRFSRLAKDA